MFPLLPILILLLLGPANAERLAVEGRLPAPLLAAHRAMAAPVRVAVVAPVEEESARTTVRQGGPSVRLPKVASTLPRAAVQEVAAPGWPVRAGPRL